MRCFDCVIKEGNFHFDGIERKPGDVWQMNAMDDPSELIKVLTTIAQSTNHEVVELVSDSDIQIYTLIAKE